MDDGYSAIAVHASIFTRFLCQNARYWHRFYEHLHSIAGSEYTEATMMDVVYLLIVIGFFSLSAAIVYGCERLRKPS